MKKIAVALFLCIFSINAHEHVLVGISGGTGSGKTTLAENILECFGEDAVLISQDSYYKDLSNLSLEERERVNFDHPDSLDFDLLEEHLLTLRSNKPINQPIYDFVTHTRIAKTKEIQPGKLILVEGILLLAVPNVCNLFDLKIFVDTDDDIRILRRLERDLHERGRDFGSVKNQYLATVKPMHEKFVQPSKNRADVVVWGVNENFNIVTGLISGYMNSNTTSR